MATHIPAVTKFSSKIIRILGCNPGTMTLQGTNTYLLGSGNKRILLDTGESDKPEYIDHLKQVLSAESASLEHIIISHWHHDHIGGVQDIFKYLSPNNCKVWKYKRTDGDEPNTGGIQVNELHKNQKFFTEGATLKVVHTPGHTTDHIILNLEEENALFSGDCILGETTAVFEDLHSYILSLQKILSLNPSVIYPGHGPVVNSPMEKIRYYIEHRNKREQEILSALNDTTNENKTQWSEMELVKKIYKDTPEHLHVPASINVNHHLKKLLKEGKVIHVDNKWSIRSNL